MSTYMDIVSKFTFHFRYSIVLPNNNYLIWIINLDEGNNCVDSPTTFSFFYVQYTYRLFGIIMTVDKPQQILYNIFEKFIDLLIFNIIHKFYYLGVIFFVTY